MAVSTKLRFEVLRRDGFQCFYCGKTIVETSLEIDHITPVSKKGKDTIDNLIAACKDCNRGKSAEIITEEELILHEANKILTLLNSSKYFGLAMERFLNVIAQHTYNKAYDEMNTALQEKIKEEGTCKCH